MKKTTRDTLAIGVSLLFLAILFEIFVHRTIYKYDEVGFCKDYIANEISIQKYFGKIHSMRPTFRGARRRMNSKGDVVGRHCYYIRGQEASAKVLVEWQKTDKKFTIGTISIREGLVSKRILLPENKSVESNYLLPARIGDGIILAGLSGLSFYVSYKLLKGGWILGLLSTFNITKNYTKVLSNLFIFAGITQLIWSILCLLKLACPY